MWLRFHYDAAARQTAGDEGAGGVALRHGQYMSFCSIARLLGVSDVAVLNWIRDEAQKLPEPKGESEQVIVTLDEMWHFIQKKLVSSGFGGPTTLWLGEPSPGLWVAVMTKPAKSSSTKSASKARPSSRTTGTATTASSRRTSSSPARI
jgi:transposase